MFKLHLVIKGVLVYSILMLVLLSSCSLWAQNDSLQQPTTSKRVTQQKKATADSAKIGSTEGSNEAQSSNNFIFVYFILLVFATIINRILEYVKLYVRWIWPRSPFLQQLWQTIWMTAKKKLDQLKIKYNEENIKQGLSKITIMILLHTLGFIIGIALCVAFNIGVIHYLITSISASSSFNHITTGILAGAGVDPIHQTIRLTQEKKKLKKLYAQIVK